jgi:hypothetical protein
MLRGEPKFGFNRGPVFRSRAHLKFKGPASQRGEKWS